MNYILAALIVIGIIANYLMGRYFVNKISKLFSSYRSEMLKFSEVQRINSAKLVELLNKLFVTSEQVQVKQEPNDIGKVDVDEIEFAEENPITLPKDIKFEVEGGDSFIPPGYTQQSK